jgi:hypothetical protein
MGTVTSCVEMICVAPQLSLEETGLCVRKGISPLTLSQGTQVKHILTDPSLSYSLATWGPPETFVVCTEH